MKTSGQGGGHRAIAVIYRGQTRNIKTDSVCVHACAFYDRKCVHVCVCMYMLSEAQLEGGRIAPSLKGPGRTHKLPEVCVYCSTLK